MLCIAHRGYSGIAPENTLAAFRAALEINAEAIELDVHLSKDEKLVVIHDETLDRTTNGKGLVREKTLEELKELDAGSWFHKKYQGEKIPTLEEVFALIKHTDIKLAIELKAAGTAEKVVELVERKGKIKDVLLLSFSPLYLLSAKNLSPNIARILLAYSRKTTIDNDEIRLLIEKAKSVSAIGLGINHEVVDRKFVSLIHQTGLLLSVYTVNDLSRFKELIKLGVDMIATDFPNLGIACYRDESEFA